MPGAYDISAFERLRVAVAGDLVADHYLHAEPRKLSREAPVMVLRHAREHLGAGGAANVARNLRALGTEVALFGALGRDANGRELRHLLEREDIDVEGVAQVGGWITPTKTRILAAEARRSPQQVLRIDREPAGPVEEGVRRQVAGSLLARGADFDALIVSDYSYGLVGPELGHSARALAARGTTVVLDPRQDLDDFSGLAALTPNVGELARFVGADPDRLDDARELQRAASLLLRRARCRWLLVTRGNLGMALFGEGLGEGGVAVDASGSGEVTDVSGAGDTAAAVFTLALAAGLAPSDAMVVANAASGVVVMEQGTAVCPRAELEAALATTPPALRLAERRAP